MFFFFTYPAAPPNPNLVPRRRSSQSQDFISKTSSIAENWSNRIKMQIWNRNNPKTRKHKSGKVQRVKHESPWTPLPAKSTKSETTKVPIIVGLKNCMFKTPQEMADYFAWPDVPPVFEVTPVGTGTGSSTTSTHASNTGTEEDMEGFLTVCEITESTANKIKQFVSYSEILVHWFDGQKVNALFPTGLRDCFHKSVEECEPRPNPETEFLFPVIVNKGSKWPSDHFKTRTLETEVTSQEECESAERDGRTPRREHFPARDIIFVGLDRRVGFECFAGETEIVWLKNRPLFAWRPFNYDPDKDWDDSFADSKDVAAQNEGVHVITGGAESNVVEKVDVDASDNNENDENYEDGGIEKKAIETPAESVSAGPHTGTDVMDWAEREDEDEDSDIDFDSLKVQASARTGFFGSIDEGSEGEDAKEGTQSLGSKLMKLLPFGKRG